MGEFIRLQKILAQAGFGSRRSCETFILEGRVTVDSTVVRHLGTKADPETQVVTLDGEKVAGPGKAGRRLQDQSAKVYYALNKPIGVLCTNEDPDRRPLAIQMIPEKRRLFCVGRLDLDTEGLLLLTNDGELTHQLTHPRFGVPKTYMAKVDGPVSGFQLAKLKKGVFLSEGRTQSSLVRVRKHGQHTSTLEITIHEGLNRQIRRMLAAVGLQCRTLKRIKIGPLALGAMPTGAYRLLGRDEVEALRRASTTAGQMHAAPTQEPESEEDLAGMESHDEKAGASIEHATRAPRPFASDERRQRQEKTDRKPNYRGERHERDQRDMRPDRRAPYDHSGRSDAQRRPEGRREEGRYAPRDRGEGAGRSAYRERQGGDRERKPYRPSEGRPDARRRPEGRREEGRYAPRDRGEGAGRSAYRERQGGDRERKPYRPSEGRPDARRRPEGRREESRYVPRDRGEGAGRSAYRERQGGDRERKPYRPPEGRFDRPQRRDDQHRPNERRRDEGRGSNPRSTFHGKPRDGGYTRGAGPRDRGGPGERPWQKNKDRRQGGPRRDEGRRGQSRRRDEH